MFKMFAQAFAALETLFKAFEKLANATNHLAEWSEETAGAFADEARIQRQAKANTLAKELKVSSK